MATAVAAALLSFVTGCGDDGTQTANAPATVADNNHALPEEAVPDEHQRVEVTVDETGFHPASIHARAGGPVTLVLTRVTDRGCGQEIVFPDQDIRRDLPLNRPVEITVTAARGEIRFTCGMGMLRGAIVGHVPDDSEQPPAGPT